MIRFNVDSNLVMYCMYVQQNVSWTNPNSLVIDKWTVQKGWTFDGKSKRWMRYLITAIHIASVVLKSPDKGLNVIAHQN